MDKFHFNDNIFRMAATREAMLKDLISAYSKELDTPQTDAESERGNEIKIFIQQLRFMLAGEAPEVEVTETSVTDSDACSMQIQKRARPAEKTSIIACVPEGQGTIFRICLARYITSFFRLCCQ